MATWMLAIFMLSGSSRVDVPIQVDLIELNHAQNREGFHGFDQVIIWQWSPDYRRYDAQYWIAVGPQCISEYPIAVGKQYQCISNRDGRRIVFRSRMYRETWTEGDPERTNQKLFPCEMRRKY